MAVESSHIMSEIYNLASYSWFNVVFWSDVSDVFFKVKLANLETFICLPTSWNASSKKKKKSDLYFVLKWYGQEF